MKTGLVVVGLVDRADPNSTKILEEFAVYLNSPLADRLTNPTARWLETINILEPLFPAGFEIVSVALTDLKHSQQQENDQ